MKRREFITLVGAAALSRPLVARAQKTIPVVGFLSIGSPDAFSDRVTAFQDGLKAVGYIDGQNVSIEYRWADFHDERLPQLAADLVRRRVSAIATFAGTPPALAAKAATNTIPIVVGGLGTDPVEVGLVDSLNRPGGNITAITSLGIELGPKRLELLYQFIPVAKTIALLVNPTTISDTATQITDVQAAARRLGLQVNVVRASTDREIDGVFASLLQDQAGGLVITPDPFLNSRRQRLGELTLRHALPAVFQFRQFVAAGGLLSYGARLQDGWRLVGVYVGRILKGEKPADLPVQQATKIELILNMKTAKAIGLTVPLPVLGRADEVIE